MADLVLPQLGETVTEGTITRWFKNPGDAISVGEMLYEVSTDKVDSEVPSPMEGVLTEIRVPEGETVDVGTVLAIVELPEGAVAPPPDSAIPVPSGAPAEPAAAPTAAAAEPPAVPAAAPVAASAAAGRANGAANGPATDHGSHLLSPVVRRLVREHGLDPAALVGTGVGGRITRSDVLNAIDERQRAAAASAGPARRLRPDRLPANALRRPVRRPCQHRSPPLLRLNGPTATRATSRSTTSAAEPASTW